MLRTRQYPARITLGRYFTKCSPPPWSIHSINHEQHFPSHHSKDRLPPPHLPGLTMAETIRFPDFARTLPENCVEYMLFVVEAETEPKKVLSGLEAARKAGLGLCNQLAKDYIWQRDGFGLDIKSDNGTLCDPLLLHRSGIDRQPGLHYLHGLTDYGDAIEDEWLIVYLIRELTKQFPCLWARLSDSDGEFLLIEAANVLPKWLSPENDAHRAWIHGGHLRIIPQNNELGMPSGTITLPQAVDTIRTATDSLVYSAFIEAEAFYRLEKYPGQVQESMHHALVTIPRRLAYLLHELPKAIAPAVEAFYLRDPIALKPLLSETTEKLVFPPTDLVKVSVQFTKVLYAQLLSQHFSPPPAWQATFASLGAGPNHDGGGTDQKEYSMLELGMKVTCGFEMLAVSAAKSNNRTTREVALILEDMAEDGEAILPSDADIASWKDSVRNDDDAWMDINFEDFERELGGRKTAPNAQGFGDANAQADLRKIVSRFEAFLNDKNAGVDGAEFEEMDQDDDEEDLDSEMESDGEDRDVSFDEEEFSRMMREMMGVPIESTPGRGPSRATDTTKRAPPDDLEEDSEDEEIRKLSEQMEAELRGHGALSLDPASNKTKALKGKGKEVVGASSQETNTHEPDEGASDDEEVDIDYNLAKNLLESFKGQAGLAGPVGTILADMGIRLPRDEDDEIDQ